MMYTTSVSILIVDQEPVTMQGLRRILEHARWKVILEAQTAQEAINAATRSQPDIILIKNKKPRISGASDYRRPQLDAIQVTQSLLNAVSSLSILIVCDDIGILQSAFEAGALGYILTQQAEADLVSAIEQLLLGRTFFSAAALRLLRVRYHRQSYPNEYKPLTPREIEVLQLIAEGKMNKEVAAALGVSLRTVEAHRAVIMEKLKLENLIDLVRYAIRTGIIEP